MATHQYSRVSSALSMMAKTNHTFTTATFSVPAGERFVRLKVVNPNTSKTNIYMRGNALTVFGGGGMYNTWASSVSSIWTNGNGCSIEVRNNGDSTVSVRIEVIFETEDLPRYTVTTAVSGSGTLTANVSSAYQGQTITLTPKASTGYTLSKYTSSPSVSISNNKFTMPASNVTVTATFTNQTYAITVNSDDPSMGSVTGGGTFAYQASVPIVATPEPGYAFTHWTTTAGTIADVNAASTTFTVPNGTATITAHFELSQSILGRYNNGEWEDCMVSYYDGSSWKDCDVFRYSGSAWEKISKA